MRFRLTTMAIGSEATLSILRERRQVEVPIKLTSAPESPPAQKTLMSGAEPLAGSTVANLSPALSDQLQLDSDWSGVVVFQVRRGSAAYRLGLRSGDIIAAINGQTITNVGELQAAVNGAQSWEITFRREGQSRTLKIE